MSYRIEGRIRNATEECDELVADALYAIQTMLEEPSEGISTDTYEDLLLLRTQAELLMNATGAALDVAYLLADD